MDVAGHMLIALAVVLGAFALGRVYAGFIVIRASRAKRIRQCPEHGLYYCVECRYNIRAERPDDELERRMEIYWRSQVRRPDERRAMSSMFAALAERALLVLVLWSCALGASYGQFLKCEPTKDALGAAIFGCYPDPAYKPSTTPVLGFPCAATGLQIILSDGSCAKLAVVDPAATATTGYVIAPDGSLRALDNIATPAAWSLRGSGAVRLANLVVGSQDIARMHTGDLPWPQCMPCESSCPSQSCLHCHFACPGDAVKKTHPRVPLVKTSH